MIRYITGDATRPQGEGLKVVAHVCNNVNRFGAGFAKAVAERWPYAKEVYIQHPSKKSLGMLITAVVATNIRVCHMIAQDGLRSVSNPVPLRYDALETCLFKLNDQCQQVECSIHMPRIGAGLAGGDWNRIEALINKCLPMQDVTIYDLPKRG